MTLADRFEGQEVGVCGCGGVLVWARDAEGTWHVSHADALAALVCSADKTAVGA
jgi:hypothetical protein